jgi:purine-binding chemotaxis protein CheW
MSDIAQLVVFRLDERRYALPLAVVERIVRAVDVTPLP